MTDERMSGTEETGLEQSGAASALDSSGGSPDASPDGAADSGSDDGGDSDETVGGGTDSADPVHQVVEYYRRKLPPPRSLTPDEVAVELARLLVGTVSLLGTGVVQALARFGIPESELPRGPDETPGVVGPGSAPVTPAEQGALVEGAASGDGRAGVLSADDPIVRTILTGMVLDLAGGVVGRSRAARARFLRFLQLGPIAMSPLTRLAMAFPPIRRRVEGAQETMARWYEIGMRERDASRVYASHALLAITDVGTDFIVEELDVNRIVERLDIDGLLSNIELTNVIIDSTGGLTETAVTGIRSQAVGADSLVERIANRILPRRAGRMSDEPPPLFLDDGSTPAPAADGSGEGSAST